MNRTFNYKRLFVVVSLVIVVTVITSLTLGKNIYENSSQGIMSFAVINFFGYLFFFLLMPVELAFIYYLRSGYDPLVLNMVAVSTAFVSESIDYVIGYFFSTGIIEKMIGRSKYEKAEEEIRKYGNWALLVSNILPLSSPVISLAAGMLKYRVKEAIFYSFTGIVLRYLLLTFIFG